MARQLWEHKVKKPKDLTSREKNMAKKAQAPAKTGGSLRKTNKQMKGGC